VTTLVRPREGRPALDGPYKGVPDFLRRPLTRWLENVYTITPDTLSPRMDEAGLERLAALLRIDLRGTDGFGMLIGILAWTDDNDERLLAVIHYTLQIPTRMPKMWNELEILLAYGASMWQATDKGLQRRVDATAMDTLHAATAVPDNASDHLALAWAGAYGRHPHPASAWYHSIKALEATLGTVVYPNDPTVILLLTHRAMQMIDMCDADDDAFADESVRKIVCKPLGGCRCCRHLRERKPWVPPKLR